MVCGGYPESDDEWIKAYTTKNQCTVEVRETEGTVPKYKLGDVLKCKEDVSLEDGPFYFGSVRRITINISQDRGCRVTYGLTAIGCGVRTYEEEAVVCALIPATKQEILESIYGKETSTEQAEQIDSSGAGGPGEV